MVEFDEADHAVGRGSERGVSNAEMLNVIELGRPIRKEPAYVRRGATVGFGEERVTFTHSFRSRPNIAIWVVAGVSDDNPNCVVVTCWTKQSR